MKPFGVICCLPPVCERTLAFLKHFRQKKTDSKVIFLTEDATYLERNLENVVVVDNPPKTYGFPVAIRVSDCMAAQMFCHAIKVATKNDFDYFIWLEPDCYICHDHWDISIATEVLRCNGECGGTPVYYNPVHGDVEWCKRFTAYSHIYSQLHDVPIALEGSQPSDDWRYQASPILFPNGALAMYRTEMLLEAFKNPLMDFADFRNEAIFFDQAVGIHLAKIYGPKVFSKVVPLQCIYSGCGNHYLTSETRKLMAESGAYAAIHQYHHYEQ